MARSHHNTALAGLAGLALSLSAHAAVSGEADAADDTEAKPLISIEGSAELQSDFTRSAGARTTSIYTTVEPEITVNVTNSLSVFSHLVFEPVLDPVDGKTNVFHGQGLYAEELYAALAFGDFSVKAGKIDPVFGLASDVAPGLYAADLASDYDLKGRLGLAGTWSSDEADGENIRRQSIDLAVFTADPTFLSQSLFVDQGRYHFSDDRVGNTDVPQSFTLAYSWQTLDKDEDVAGPSFRAALSRLAARNSALLDQWSALVAAETLFDIGDDQTLHPLVEINGIINEDGRHRDAAVLTASLAYANGPWTASIAAATHRSIGNAKIADSFVTADLGRTFEADGIGPFTIDAAWKIGREDGARSQTFGLRLHKDFGWTSSGG